MYLLFFGNNAKDVVDENGDEILNAVIDIARLACCCQRLCVCVGIKI